MKKPHRRLISAMSVILLSAPAVAQVVNGGATGSIGGSITGTLQRPSAIDRMHVEQQRIGQASAGAAGEARQSAELTTAGARDRAVDGKQRVTDGASKVAADASATASGALSVTQSTTADSVQPAAQFASSAAATANGSVSSNHSGLRAAAPVETPPSSQVGESSDNAVDARGIGAADAMGELAAQTPPSREDAESDPTTVMLDTDLSGGEAANVAANPAHGKSSAQAQAGAHRDGTSISGNASGSAEANAQINSAN